MWAQKKQCAILDSAIKSAHRSGVPVARACEIAGASRSTFYRRIGNPGKRVLAAKALGDRIKVLQKRHEGRYGVRRMTAALRMDGHKRKPGHNQVARAMKELGCQAVIRRKSTYRVSLTKGRLADGTVLENTLNRKFTQQEPGKVFVTDVTYIPTKTGWLYLSLVMDLCTREIVVCEMSPCQNMALAMQALHSLKAVASGPAVLHSDQGVLYTSPMFRKQARDYGFKQSYSRKGNCWDNAVMEG
ncbi:IS3 family transposase [Mesosutterella porci]|uniref:IS3 family transposase n=1 Tax=Mesosutterella porci TaxID=2915351 RepID=UPI002DD6A8E2|nr:IS3 family transposase [Mesosutterella sp. oilRF-744-WT-GAM-9]